MILNYSKGYKAYTNRSKCWETIGSDASNRFGYCDEAKNQLHSITFYHSRGFLLQTFTDSNV